MTRAISPHRPARVVEVVKAEATGDDVERGVVERQRLGRAHDVGLHPGGGIGGRDQAAESAETPRHVAAAGSHVQRCHALAWLAPGDELVEVVTRRV